MSKKKSVYRIESHDGYYFNINEEKRTVVAVLESDPWAAVDQFIKVFDEFENKKNFIDFPFSGMITSRSDLATSYRYIGVAKCNDDDEFDLEFGKKLALAKAKEKRIKAVRNKFSAILSSLEKLEFMAGKHYDKIYREWVNNSSNVYTLLCQVGYDEVTSEADSE